ncbi:MAG: branched-chain amino acid ABC transporter permease [Immundisolibacterales bacterium]|nr:branched-chain amino acid ABC transporter permease [Immundisolibacterales bacterium]
MTAAPADPSAPLAAGRNFTRRVLIAAAVVVAVGVILVRIDVASFMNALGTVSILMIVALGLTIIFGILKIANFAHGDFVMVGAYVTWGVQSTMGFDGAFFIALPAAFLAVALLGLIVEAGALRFVYGRGLIPPMLVTWALGIIIHEAISVIFGRHFKSVKLPIKSPIEFFGVSYPGYTTFLVATGIVVVVALIVLFSRTSFGAKSRAAAEDATMAEAVGINVRNVYKMNIALGAGLAGLAGSLLSPLYAVEPLMGTLWLMKSFLVLIVGGVGNILGTIVGANAMGWPEQLLGAELPSSIHWPPLVLAQVIVFALAIVLILLRPQGLLGGVSHRED